LSQCHSTVTAENGGLDPLEIVTTARPFGHSKTIFSSYDSPRCLSSNHSSPLYRRS